jgi:hypothetical protein
MKRRSLFAFVPVGLEQVAVVQVTRRPPAITSPLDADQACVPVVRFETRRTTTPYCTPAVSGVLNVKSNEEGTPLEVPVTVFEASRPAAVMTGRPAAVVRSSRVMFGLVPEQPEHQREAETLVTFAVTAGVKVCPMIAVELKP